MKIGIDISQLAYKNTGVATYLLNLVSELLRIDTKNDYILFFSSLRGSIEKEELLFKRINNNVKIVKYKFPPSFLDVIWNKLHILPIERLIGDVDFFITSDWTEPPVTRAKKATIIYDMIVYKHPNETAKKIIDTQKRKHKWVCRECSVIFCISEATKNDAQKILNLPVSKIKIIYPGN